MTSILVVDDHPVVREGLVSLLGAEPEFRIVGEAGSGEEALRDAARLRPDVVVLDIRLPGMSGNEACAALVQRQPGIAVIMLTCFPHEGTLTSAFSSGAKGFVLKESQPRVFRQAVREVAQGNTFTDPLIVDKADALANRKRGVKGPLGLTVPELHVLEQLPRGMSNREIGAELGISEDTVKTHVRNILQKLKARDRAEAASIAVRQGLA